MDLTIPETKLVAVEYPGYVKHEDRVLETLGGLEGISRQLQDTAAVLPLKFRPEDPYCHAIYGDRHHANSLLVKLTRRRKQRGREHSEEAGSSDQSTAQRDAHEPEKSPCTIEAVAQVDSVFRFTSPADYQYVGADPRPNAAAPLSSEQRDPPGFAPQPLLSTPPLFAKAPIFDYAFKGYKSNVTSADDLGASRRRAATNMINFFSPETPPAPPGPIEVSPELQPLLDALSFLVKQRPIWVGMALSDALPAAYSWDQAKELLPKLCYRFRNGPWKHAWVRRGFDPRTTLKARGYQALEYHLPSEWYAKISEHRRSKAAAEQGASKDGEKLPRPAPSPVEAAAEAVLPPIASTHAQLLRFEAVPATQSCYLPLRFIRDSRVQQILRDPANHMQHCSDSSGWLSRPAWEGIRKRVKERYQAVLDGRPVGQEEDDSLLGDLEAEEVWEPGEGEVSPQQPQQKEEVAQRSEQLAERAQQQLQLGAQGSQANRGRQALEMEGGGQGAAHGGHHAAAGPAGGATSAAAAATAAAASAAGQGTAEGGGGDVEMRDVEEAGDGAGPRSGPPLLPPQESSPLGGGWQGPPGTGNVPEAGEGSARGMGEGLLPDSFLESLQRHLDHLPGDPLEDEDAYEILEGDEDEEEEGEGGWSGGRGGGALGGRFLASFPDVVDGGVAAGVRQGGQGEGYAQSDEEEEELGAGSESEAEGEEEGDVDDDEEEEEEDADD